MVKYTWLTLVQKTIISRTVKANKADENEDAKRKGGYPYLPLNLSLKVSDAVKELGGARSGVQKSVLAKHLGDSEKSGTFSQRITAAKCFGLIQGHGAYSLTEIAKRYYFPTAEPDKSAALLEIFSSPPAFKELLRRFDGDKLPTRDILGNILHRDMGVPESWRDRIAAFFANSAQFVGVIDSQGFLRLAAAIHAAPVAPPSVDPPKDQPPLTTPPTPPQPTPPIVKPSDGANVWHFSYKGKSVRLETPAELDKPLWEKLNAYVQLLQPNEEVST